jgi:hypothetical protein
MSGSGELGDDDGVVNSVGAPSAFKIEDNPQSIRGIPLS